MKRGFTLAEIIITFAIVSIGIGGLLAAFSKSMTVSKNIEEQESALMIAEAAMEKFKAGGYKNLQSYNTVSEAVISGMTGYSVAATCTQENPARVEIVVSWQVSGGVSSISLSTLMANY